METLLTELQRYITFLKDLATIISLVIAGIIAIKGLETWRQQLKGPAITSARDAFSNPPTASGIHCRR